MGDTGTPDGGTWGACRFCGVAVRAGASRCEICGAERPLRAGEIATAPRRLRRRLKLTGILRSMLVVGVIAGILYAVVSAEISGPPNLSSDPLSTTGSYLLSPGNFTVISGEITGGDYVLGNFTAVDPVGLNVSLAVYNSTGWTAFAGHLGSDPVWALDPAPSGRIVYSAPVTDNYYFVFSNPYPSSTHFLIDVYVVTQYETNVATGGGFM